MQTNQERIRTALLSADFYFETVFGDRYNDHLKASHVEVISRMWDAMWHNYVKNRGTVSTVYYSDLIDDTAVLNAVLEQWSEAGWVIVSTEEDRNWSDARLNEDKLLTFVSPDELAAIRASSKFVDYVPNCRKASTRTTAVRVNGKQKHTGLVREGFAAAANTQYYFDTRFLNKYKEAITLNVNKGMSKVRELWSEMVSDQASFDAICSDIVEHLAANPQVFNQGGNTSDSRGRAIKDSLSKVGNPIGYKDFRALLTIPADVRNAATPEGEAAVYLFIAELLGIQKDYDSVAHKEQAGREAYQSRKLLKLNLDIEDDRSDLFENIWLERLYEELDELMINRVERSIDSSVPAFCWSVPIELDASASMLQYMGVLLDDDRLMRRTNMIGTSIGDSWATKTNRKKFKAVGTPRIYGSSAATTYLLDNAKLDYTLEEIRDIDYELSTGAFGAANAFKDLLINYCKPQETMNIRIWNDEFQISCNRFKRVDESVKFYQLYDSASGMIKEIVHHTPVMVPDLNQFRRYFATLLIHNLDSQVADRVAGTIYNEYEWVLDIHDAFIVSPEAAARTRQLYGESMEEIHNNRKSILANYFQSIGIGSDAQHAINALAATVEKYGQKLVVNPIALK